MKVSASTAAFNLGMERAQDKAQDLSLSLFRLGRASNEAEGEIDSAGRSALTTGSMFSSLAVSTEGLSLSMGSLSGTITTVLIPALGALATTLVPLAAVVGTVAAAATGLAGAFGLIIGSGLIAYGQRLGDQNKQRLKEINARIARLEALEDTQAGLTQSQQEQLDALEEQANKLEKQTGVMGGLKQAMGDLVSEIKPMIVAFGQQFIPLIEDAIEALPQLVQNILDQVGGLDQFKQALRDAGSAAMEAIPSMIGTLTDLAREALPMVRNSASWLLENGGDIFDEMVATTKEVGPQLIELGGTLADLIPVFNRMGTWVINTGVPAFQEFVRIMGTLSPIFNGMGRIINRLANFLGNLSQRQKTLVGQFVILTPLALKLAGVLTTLGSGLATVLGAVGALGPLMSGIASTGSIIVTVLSAFAHAAFYLVTALNPVTLAIGAIVAALAGLFVAYKTNFLGFKDGVDWAVSGIIDTLEGLWSWFTTDLPNGLAVGLGKALVTAELLLNTLKNTFKTIWNGIVGIVQSGVNAYLTTIEKGLNGIIDVINRAIEVIPWDRVPGISQPDQLGNIEAPQLDMSSFESNIQRQNESQVRREVVERIGRITVENGEIVAKMDERAQLQTEEQARGAARNTATNTAPR